LKLTTVHQNQTESIILSFNSAGYPSNSQATNKKLWSQ